MTAESMPRLLTIGTVSVIVYFCLQTASALTGSPRMARDSRSPYSAMSQARRSRYYYFITSRQYTYYHERYSALQRSIIGSARYSRVYSQLGKYSSAYYQQYFSFVRSSAYEKYKGRMHREISVCRNFEANENGSYLGIYTCPLPFEPENYAYCCGESNAEYCCRFQDSTTNVIGAIVLSLFIICPIGFIVFALQRWFQKEARTQREMRRRWKAAMEKFDDRDRKEQEKADVRKSIYQTAEGDDMSLSTVSLPSLPSSCSSTVSLRQWETLAEERTDQSDVPETIEPNTTDQSNIYATSERKYSDQSTISSLKYFNQSVASKAKPEKEQKYQISTIAYNTPEGSPSRRSCTVHPLDISTVIGQEGAVECRGLSRVTIHLPEAWSEINEAQDAGSANRDYSREESWF